jgi:hypothetical protein
VNACIEEIDYRTASGLDKSVIRALTQESGWVGTHENIFVLGPTGFCLFLSQSSFEICGELFPQFIRSPLDLLWR